MPLRKSLQLLHIDDSATLRKTVERGLEPYKDNYVLTQASSVDEGYSLIESKKFDIILTDWLMNGKDGLTLLKMLKSHPAYHHLPVFFLTSEYESSSLATTVNYGASGLLKKPSSGADIHAYFQNKASYIEGALQVVEDTFTPKAKSLLNEIQQRLPLKDPHDISNCLRFVQLLKAQSASAKWPLLSDYCVKVENLIQASIKKGIANFAPLNAILTDFHSFMVQAVSNITSGKPHDFLSAETENGFKDYLRNLEAGWFSKNGAEVAADVVVLPREFINDLKKHISPEGLALLEPYLAAAARAK